MLLTHETFSAGNNTCTEDEAQSQKGRMVNNKCIDDTKGDNLKQNEEEDKRGKGV